MTIDNPQTVRFALLNGGEIEGYKFPLIYSYTSNGGNKHFALFTDVSYDDTANNPFIESYCCLMANGIVTKMGDLFLKNTNVFSTPD